MPTSAVEVPSDIQDSLRELSRENRIEFHSALKVTRECLPAIEDSCRKRLAQKGENLPAAIEEWIASFPEPAQEPIRTLLTASFNVQAEDVAALCRERWEEPIRQEIDRMMAEAGDPQLNEFAQQQAQADADNLCAALQATREGGSNA
jgi:ribosomal 50S subunit-associated protein YjgA (DUF615 family)